MRHDGRLTELVAAPRGACGLLISIAQAYVDKPDIFLLVVGILNRFVDMVPAARNELKEGNGFQCLTRMASHLEKTKFSSSKIGSKSMTSLNHLVVAVSTTTVQ